MLPSVNVMGATLTNLVAPTEILALLAVLVVFLVIFAGLIGEFRSVAALRGMASTAPPPGAAPAESASQMASRGEAA